MSKKEHSDGVNRRQFLKTAAGVGIAAGTGNISKLATVAAPMVEAAATSVVTEAVKLSLPAAQTLHAAEILRSNISGNLKGALEEFISQGKGNDSQENVKAQLSSMVRNFLTEYKQRVEKYAAVLHAVPTHYEEIRQVIDWTKNQKKLVEQQNAEEQLQYMLGALRAWINDPRIPEVKKEAIFAEKHAYPGNYIDRRLNALQENPDELIRSTNNNDGKARIKNLRRLLNQPLSLKDENSLKYGIYDIKYYFENLLHASGASLAPLEKLKSIKNKLPAAITKLWRETGFIDERDESMLSVGLAGGRDTTPEGKFISHHTLHISNTPEYARETFDIEVKGLPHHISWALNELAPQFGHLPEYRKIATEFGELLHRGLPEIVEEIKPGTMQKVYEKQAAEESYEKKTYGTQPKEEDRWEKSYAEKEEKRGHLEKLMQNHIEQRFEIRR